MTARVGSERFPGKVLQEVEGYPLLWWITKRLEKGLKNSVIVVATTQNKEDDDLAILSAQMGIPCYRYKDPDDVVGRISGVLENFPNAKYVVRALGDCPFMEPLILKEVVSTLDRFKADAFSWMLPPETLPVYGAREFPYSVASWSKIDKGSKGFEREHVDMWFNAHRSSFKIVYHEPPPSDYFRLYRLEVDWPEDLELVRQIAKGPGMLASIPEINRWLDSNPDVTALNSMRHEKTGPTINYDYRLRRSWYKAMSGHSIVGWDGQIWDPPTNSATPVFCSNEHCLVGYGHEGQLFLKDGSCIRGNSRITCQCGAGRIWKNPIRSSSKY